MQREDPRQCQALNKNNERCKCKAQHFFNGRNLCNRHQWLEIAKKREEKK